MLNLEELNYKDTKLYSLFKWKILSKLDNENERKQYQKIFNLAYFTSKLKFDWYKRDSWEPYFEHLERTAIIILEEFENPNFEKVILALLHDIVEDTNISHNKLEEFFSEECLNRIFHISKNDKNLTCDWIVDKVKYFTFDEKKITKQKYFKRLLKTKDKIVIDVKLADRIDNLRTMYIWKAEKVKKKIKETRKYILPLATKHNKVAERLILEEISKLEHYFNLNKV